MKHITFMYILSSFHTQLRTCISFCFPLFRSLVVPLYPTEDFPKLHFYFPPFPSLIVHSYPTTYLQTHFLYIFPSYQNFFPTTDSPSSVHFLAQAVGPYTRGGLISQTVSLLQSYVPLLYLIFVFFVSLNVNTSVQVLHLHYQYYCQYRLTVLLSILLQ